MNVLDEFRRDEQRVLDRLVDGELSATDRRRLLAALDDEPGGWRRCALAFLEAQTWRWQLSRVAAEPIVAHAKSSAMLASSSRTARRFAFWGKSLALAASLAVAFALGSRTGAVAPALSTSRPAGGDIAQATARPAQPSEIQDADDLPEMVTLMLDDEDGTSRPIELSVVDAMADTEWTTPTEWPVAASLLRKLQTAGLEIDREQSFCPVSLSDGRQMIVPVEQVDIHYPDFVFNQ